MKRQTQRLQPFPFESDFSAPQVEDDNLITMSANDLSVLLAETREGTANLVRDETLAAEAQRLQRVGEELRTALSTIVDLAGLLETAAIDAEDKSVALAKVRRLASTLIDGQGELFANSASYSSPGNHSD